MSASSLIPAAQYLRMSTDDQQNSIPIQREAIQHYATEHGFEIVSTYSDAGKSGIYIRNRPGLRHLLRDVLSGERRFRAILVFDVSRWGRFLDTDESAHYEFLCRRAGIPVHYCAEPFDNDCKMSNVIVKALKRAMAAEFSRELAAKTSAGHRRTVSAGYHGGGAANFGLRRVLLSPEGHRKQVLQKGECKNLKCDHTVLSPGPKREVDCVRLIFALAANKKNSPRAIAHELNRRKIFYFGNEPWDSARVYRILKNEKYVGSNVWGRNQCPLRSRPQRVPRSEWIIKPGAFPAVVTPEQFGRAEGQMLSRRRNPGNPLEFYLDRLAKVLERERKALERDPKVSLGLLEKRRKAARHACTRRLGSILRAYELIGHNPSSHVINSRDASMKINRLRVDLFRDLKQLFDAKVRMVHRYGARRFRIVDLDNRWRIGVHICRLGVATVSGESRWMLRIRPRDRGLPALICIPDREMSCLAAFYLVPNLDQVRSKWKIIHTDHPWLATENRLQSLADLLHVAEQRLQDRSVPPDEFSIIGDVVFRHDDPTIIVDDSEIHLSRTNAAILRLLLKNAGRVVPRIVLSLPHTGAKAVYLNARISAIRQALGPRFRNRIVTVTNEGYMYLKVPTPPSI